MNDLIGRRLLNGLTKISVALKSQSWNKASKRGLTPTQVQILTLIHLGSKEGMSLSKVAEGLGVTMATTSDAVNVLSLKKLLRKSRSPLDGRSLVLSLTDKGRKEVALSLAWSDFFMEAVGRLSPYEQAVFLRVIIKLIRSLQDNGRIPVSRMCVTCKYFKPNASSDFSKPHYCKLVNAYFGEGELRVDCPDHEAGLSEEMAKVWDMSLSGKGGEM